MSKRVKLFACPALLAGLMAAMPGEAEAYWRRHGWYGGGWGPSIGFGFGWGYPYYARPYYGPYYGGPYYAPPPRCGYVRVRVWRRGHWVLRRAWRCW